MKYKAIKFFGIAAMLLLPFLAGAQQPQNEEEAAKQMREAINQSVENYERLLGLEDWQTFYVDSILTHDYEALRVEVKALQTAKMTTPTCTSRCRTSGRSRSMCRCRRCSTRSSGTSTSRAGPPAKRKRATSAPQNAIRIIRNIIVIPGLTRKLFRKK